MIVIAGHMSVHPEDRAALLEAMGPRIASTRADEPGCLAYAFSADPLDDTSVLIFERWADAEALEAHFRHPNFAAAVNVISGFRRTGGSMKKYHVDAEGEIYGADGKPTASFSN